VHEMDSCGAAGAHVQVVQRGVVVGDLVHLVQHVVAGDVEKRLRVAKLCAVRLYNMVLCGKCRFCCDRLIVAWAANAAEPRARCSALIRGHQTRQKLPT